jgi:ABC-2 type transport system ATP-binding protein
MINKGKIVALDAPQKLKASIEKRQIVEVSFDQTKNLESKLATLRDVEKVALFGDKFRLHFESTFSDVIPLLVDFAKVNNFKIVSVNTLNPSLEDVFVELTGLNVEIMKIEKEQGKKAVNLG